MDPNASHWAGTRGSELVLPGDRERKTYISLNKQILLTCTYHLTSLSVPIIRRLYTHVSGRIERSTLTPADVAVIVTTE